MIEISVVIPVYKAEACLQELYHRLKQSIAKITENFELILVEDCGGDGSWDLMKQLAAQDPRVKAIQFSRNFGQHYGITAGLDYSSGRWVVVMDCDLQDQPEEIPKLYAKAQEGYDVVIAHRKQRQDPFFKRIFSKLFYSCFRYLVGIKYDGEAGNFRIIERKVVNSLLQMREQLRFLGGMVAWVGFPTTFVEVQHAKRFAGKSSYNFRRLLNLALGIILANSDKPLKLMIKFGFFISMIAFIYGLHIMYRELVHHIPVLGWGSIIASIYFIGGIIIANMGILGIYLGKTFDETKKRPLYVIREVIN